MEVVLRSLDTGTASIGAAHTGTELRRLRFRTNIPRLFGFVGRDAPPAKVKLSFRLLRFASLKRLFSVVVWINVTSQKRWIGQERFLVVPKVSRVSPVLAIGDTTPLRIVKCQAAVSETCKRLVECFKEERDE